MFAFALIKMLDFLSLTLKQGYFDLSVAFIFSSVACLIAQYTCIRHIKFKERFHGEDTKIRIRK